MTAAGGRDMPAEDRQGLRASLLNVLVWAGLAAAALLAFLVAALPSLGAEWLASSVLGAMAAGLTRDFLRRERHGSAAWAWVTGNGLAIGAPIVLLAAEASMRPGLEALYLAWPFSAVLVVLLSGVLLPPQGALGVLAAQAVSTLMLPAYLRGVVAPMHVAAFALSLLAAGLEWLLWSLYGEVIAGASSGAHVGRRSEQLLRVAQADLERLNAERDVLGERLRGAEAETARAAQDLDAAVEMSRLAALDAELGSVLQGMALVIGRRLDAFAALYQIEEGEGEHWLRLAATSADRADLAPPWSERVAVSERSALGRCVLERASRRISDVRGDGAALDHVLPDARSEAVVPLIARSKLLGVLDVQSSDIGAFGEGDVALLEVLANQVASAVAYAEVVCKAQGAFQELAQLQQRYVREAWSRFAPQLAAAGYRFEQGAVSPLGHHPLPEVRRAVSAGRTVVQEDDHAVVAPIALRGEVIGALGLRDPGGERQWTEEDLALVDSVARQMAVIIDNARLVQETQRSLAEITELNRRYVREAWNEYLPQRRRREYVFAQPGVPIERPLPDEMERAFSASKPVTLRPEGGEPESALIAPISLREEALGALGIEEVGQTREWSEEDLELVDAVASQMSWAIENARLFEETEQRARELEATARQLQETDQFRAQFLANMSHELRTPLNSIIGFSRVILKGIDGPLTELQRTDLEAIHSNGQHLLAMINEILDMSKLEAGAMELVLEDVNLDSVIGDVIATSGALIKDKPIELRTHIEPRLPIIRGDGTRIRQVITNLMGNAAKFTQEGAITFRVWTDEEMVYVSVADTGEGIPADKIPLVFEPFRQADGSPSRRAEGTGLGLPISKQYVEMHGGQIWLESEYGQGCTVTFALPIEGPVGEIPELDGVRVDGNRRLVLAIDRHGGELGGLERHLDQRVYQLVVLTDSSQAVNWARYLRPWAILLDVDLEGAMGWAALEALKSRRATRAYPVVACSALDVGARAVTLGASGYVRKPIATDALAGVLVRLHH
ncbi:MAG: GAF domain-containing protein [Anaerolineae bacterium]|nr:GAF domain-containing protein [Anaerolineae bacterium]